MAPNPSSPASRRILGPTTVVLFMLCLMYGITYIDRVNVSTAAAVFRRELNLSNTQVGLVFSAFAYPYLIFQILGGWVGDRFGARYLRCGGGDHRQISGGEFPADAAL